MPSTTEGKNIKKLEKSPDNAMHLYYQASEVFFVEHAIRNAKKSAITKKAKTPAEEKIDLGAHLTEIKTIAKSKSKNNTIQPEESLKDMTEDEVLRHFIKFEQSEVHTAKLSVKTKEKEKIQTIFEHFGTDLSSRKRFTSDRTYPAKRYFDEDDDDPDREDD